MNSPSADTIRDIAAPPNFPSPPALNDWLLLVLLSVFIAACMFVALRKPWQRSLRVKAVREAREHFERGAARGAALDARAGASILASELRRVLGVLVDPRYRSAVGADLLDLTKRSAGPQGAVSQILLALDQASYQREWSAEQVAQLVQETREAFNSWLKEEQKRT